MYKYEKFWNRIANTYAKAPIKDQHTFNQTIDDIKKHLMTNDKVLDYGCGTGTYSIAIGDNVKSIHAIDFSSKMVCIATGRAKDSNKTNIRFEHMTVFDDRLQPGSFDVVLAFNILHLQQNLDETLHRINELLKPGGRLISKTVCLGEKSALFSYLIFYVIKPISKLGILPHIISFTFAELEASINKHQMQIIETKELPADTPTCFVVATKNGDEAKKLKTSQTNTKVSTR